MRRNKLEYIIPAALALVITIGLILFFPALREEYKIEILDTKTVPLDDYCYFFDLNGDGSSERLSIYYNVSRNLAVSVSSLSYATINQFNLPGRLTRLGATVDFQDIDSNGITDVFLCTEKNDSLFLTIIDDLYGHPTTTKEYFLDPINQYNDNGDYMFTPGGISDLNGDGSPEYVMAINGGHSLQPRRVYAIDYKNDTVLKSPLSGAAVVSLDLFDLDLDGRDEILLNTVAPENFKSSIPYRDSISWLMVLDDDLQFYKPPLARNPPPSWISIEPFTHEGKPYLMTYHRYREGDDYNAQMAIYSDSLKMIKDRVIRGQEHSGHYIYRVPGGSGLEDIKFLHTTGIRSYNFDLECMDSVFNDTHFGYNTEIQLDADADGEQEYVFMSTGKLHVFRADFSESASLPVSVEARIPRTLISMIEDGDAYPVLHIQMEQLQLRARYEENMWFKYRELAYPGIFILLFGLFYLLVVLQNKIISGRFEKDRLISQLQLQSIKNQLDPHFTYNALNAVGSLIYKGEKDLAYQYLRGLTDLLRMVSADSSQVTWTLDEELEFVNRYLEIEKLRFKEKFIYKVKVKEEGLKSSEVPKMSVQAFVENAIKHGLRHKDYDRKLEVEAFRLNKGIRILIKDNGIGRAASLKFRDENSGQGIHMMKQYFRQFNETAGRKSRFEVKDLFEYDLKASGTLVEITIL
ncbi:MAG: histidine kinase [Bacteroidota bacterium]